jgi:hypothetical protein
VQGWKKSKGSFESQYKEQLDSQNILTPFTPSEAISTAILWEKWQV